MKNDPNFRPPVEYAQQKRSQRPSDKVYIPVKEFPEINFFGLLVGPRGNSLKKMETESGAKISIRGKGSVKEGKARPDQYADDAEEDLHCLVLADSEEKVAACVRLINKVIETVRHVLLIISCTFSLFRTQQAASTPEGQNEHKRNQLRQLAALNGKSFVFRSLYVLIFHFQVLFVMMRTRYVRTVVVSDIVNTIVRSSATSRPTSSVVFVAALVIWPATVR